MNMLFDIVGLLTTRDIIVFEIGAVTGMLTLILVHLANAYKKPR